MIRQAPLSFLSALVLLTGLLGGGIYWLFRENLTSKNDLIRTLQAQLKTARSALPVTDAEPTIPPSSFRLLLLGGNVFIPDQMPKETGVVLDVTIINTGKPSIALAWTLSVVPRKGAPKRAQLTNMPLSLVARGMYNTTNVNSAESLDCSTLNSPLQTNAPRSGKLLFYVSLPKETVMTAVLELSVTDVEGHPYLVRQDMRDWLHH